MNKRSSYLIAAAVFLGTLCAWHASAQTTPVFLVSWSADSYVPGWYKGKALPTENTPLTISFEILRNGKFMDLSGKTVRWFSNGNLLAEGANKKTVSIKNRAYAGTTNQIRIVILNPGTEATVHELTIPSAIADVTIGSVYTGKVSGSLFSFAAAPFFFNIKNVSELAFAWKVNDAPVSGEANKPDSLEVSFAEPAAPGTRLKVSVSAQNTNSALELGLDERMLIFK